MKGTIFIIAFVVAAALYNNGYPLVALFLMIVAVWEAWLGDYVRDLRKRFVRFWREMPVANDFRRVAVLAGIALFWVLIGSSAIAAANGRCTGLGDGQLRSRAQSDLLGDGKPRSMDG